MDKIMTVSKLRRNNKSISYIRIANKLLKANGFKIGDTFKVDYKPNRIILNRSIR